MYGDVQSKELLKFSWDGSEGGIHLNVGVGERSR